MNVKKLGLLATALVLVFAMLAGCGRGTGPSGPGTSPSAGTPQQELKVGLDIDAGTADPRLARDTSARRVVDVVFNGLVWLDTELKPQPALATSWQQVDPTTWEFTLRDGVKFHDGSEFTAEDVKYTYDTILDPDFKAPYRSLYAPIKEVQVVDAHHVRFLLNQPYAPLLSYLDMGIVSKKAAEAAGAAFSSQPVGTGPFKLVKWDKNQKIEFEAFPDYWGGAPALKKLTYLIIPDNTVRAAALEAGDVDLIHSPLSPQDLPRLQNNSKLTVKKTNALGFTYVSFNCADPVLKDVRVRQALAHLIDKKAISSSIYQGMDTPGKSPLVPAMWAYSDDIKDPQYDPAQAKTLLEEAGWKDTDGDGILDKGGRKLSISLKTHSEDPNRIQVVEFLQNEFQKNGIEAKVETTEWPTFRDSVQQGKYQLAVLGWLGLVDPDRAMYNQFRSDGPNNDGKYSNPRVDELLDKGRTTADLEERKQVYREAAQIVVDEVAYDVILYQGYVVAYNNRVNGFEIHPNASFASLAKVTVK
ncbi:MAG TPA: ABC transporter substrate-binding protein [Firmicutes bacterium]|nr:ABC transporter substrate-binding protein [Bacillota bacterium]